MGWDKFVYKFHIGVKKILAPLPKTKKKNNLSKHIFLEIP